MEDFTGAYIHRKKDALALLTLNANHGIAIFHLGGVAIECRLKALLIMYHQIQGWKQNSRRTGDSLYGLPIKNPSHKLMEALKNMPTLYDKAMSDSVFLNHFSKIIHPLGSSSPDYITLRYSPKTELSTDNWQQSFNHVLGWLDQNQRSI